MRRIPILVLEKKSDLLTANTLYCLVNSKDLEVHIVSQIHDSSYRYMPGVKGFHYIPASTPVATFLDFIEQVAHKTKAAVLVPTNTEGVTFCIQHVRYLEEFVRLIPLPEKWSFDIAADKGLLAAFMLENAIPSPPTVFNFTQDIETALGGLAFPVLLKPRIGESGLASAFEEPPITVFKDKASLLQFVNERNVGYKYIIQQFVTGYVIGCNVLYKEGRLITYTIQKPLTPTRPFAPSFGIEFIDNKEVITIVDALMSRLKWNGVANLDLMYDTVNHKIQVLEINPRFWLTIIGSMVRANINFPLLACKLALNQPVGSVQPRLGKYIPFGTFVKYRVKSTPDTKVSFGWNEIDLPHFLRMLPVKLYSFYKERLRKVVRRAPERKPKAHVLASQ